MSGGRRERALAIVCLGSLMIQSFHMLEHVVQVLQKFVWLVPPHGLLGEAFDREWVHLAYNGAVEGAFITLLLGYGLYRRPTSGRREAWGRYLFLGLLAFQGYHVVEHIVKMIQYAATGTPDTPGLLGQIFPTIWVHFFLNAAVLGLMAISYQKIGLIGTAWANFPRRQPTLST